MLDIQDFLTVPTRRSSDLREALAHVCTVVWDRTAKKGARGRTVTLKLRYADFQTITRAKTVPFPITDGNSLLADRKSTRLNSSHSQMSYAVFLLKKQNFLY